jgi:hypothetical protein
MIQEVVHASGNLLAQAIPDWHWRVNPDELDMSSSSRCVLGQAGEAREKTEADGWVPSAYTTMVEKLSGIPGPYNYLTHGVWARLSGFDQLLGNAHGTWGKLDQLWKDEIQARREADTRKLTEEETRVLEPALA